MTADANQLRNKSVLCSHSASSKVPHKQSVISYLNSYLCNWFHGACATERSEETGKRLRSHEFLITVLVPLMLWLWNQVYEGMSFRVRALLAGKECFLLVHRTSLRSHVFYIFVRGNLDTALDSYDSYTQRDSYGYESECRCGWRSSSAAPFNASLRIFPPSFYRRNAIHASNELPLPRSWNLFYKFYRTYEILRKHAVTHTCYSAGMLHY